MDDKQLYELCVASGFTESQWWPHHTDPSGARWTLTHEHEEWISKSGVVYCSEDDLNARARVLAGLVEWATDGGRGIDSLFRYSTPTEHMKCKAEVHSHNRGEGTCPTTALLACFKSWKESQ